VIPNLCKSRETADFSNFIKILLGKRVRIFQRPPPPAARQAQTSLTMSVSIRLNRKGTKDRPYYKIVAVDSRKRRDGRYIEQIGTYDPKIEGTNFTIDLALADKWLGVGAKPSETVNSIIRKARTAASKA
jgi:small subunit ribosomal protein S16